MLQKRISCCLALFFALCVINEASAQGNLKELAEKIGNTRKFSRINAIAQNYFKEEKQKAAREKERTNRRRAEPEEEFENAEVFYRRWAWYNGSRLDAAGNVTDYTARNFTAINNEQASLRTQSKNSNSTWVLQGPSTYTASTFTLDGQARVDCIAFHPTNANIMYAGTPIGGLFKTVDGGATWVQNNGLFPYYGVSAIVVNQTNGNEIWALAGSAENPNTWGIFDVLGVCRVYHSVDSGANWIPADEFPGIAGRGFDLVQDPFTPNTLYAATVSGVYITTNGGGTWTRKDLGGWVKDLEINPASGRLLASGIGFVKYSDDNGVSWNDCNFNYPITSMNRGSLAISPTGSGETVYLLAGPGSSGKFLGLFRSTDGGLNFIRRTNMPNVFDTDTLGIGDWDASSYDNCIVTHPTDPQKILTGGAAVWQSSDGGASMTFDSYYWNSTYQPAKYVHPDIHSLKRNPLNNKIFVCTDGGLWVSANFGATWIRTTNGISAAQIFHMSTYKNNGVMEAFGSQDNGVKIRRMTGLYEQFSGADGYAVEFTLNDSSVMYAAQNDGFAKFTDFGTVQVACAYPFVSTVPKKHWYILPKVTPSATNTEILFAASLDTLSRSTDGGATWTRIVRRSNWDIKYAPGNNAYIYTAGGFDYSDNYGFTISRNTNYGTGAWTNISDTFSKINQRAMKLAIDPDNEQLIYVCFGGYSAGKKVFRSSNGGTAWPDNISYNLPNVPVNALATDKAGNVYAGTDIGVYVLPASATEWVAFYNNLPRVPITDLIVNDNQQFIKASTFGCGIWKSDLYGGCPTTLFLPADQRGRLTFEAANFVNAYQVTMSGGYDITDVRIRSGNYIIFTPGSDLKNGTLMASIGPCGEPFPTARTVPITLKDSATKDSTYKQKEGYFLLGKESLPKPVNQDEKPKAALPQKIKKKRQ